MAAAVVPIYLVQQLVSDVRTDSDLNVSQVYVDQQIATLISDAGSSLRDAFTGANQKYNISTFDFTLVGGVGANQVTLPADFQQGHSVDVNPTTPQPYTLRYLTNWLDRNKLNNALIFGGGPGGGPREYYLLDNQLVVLPAMGAAGNFRLYYTPMWTPLAIPAALLIETAVISIPNPGDTSMGIEAGGVSFNAGTGNTPFISSDVGDQLVITGAVNSDNNGSFTITSLLTAARVGIAGSHTSEGFPPSATATILRQSRVDGAGNWTLYGANPFNNTSIAVNVGDTLVVTGTQNNNGSFTITQAATGGISIVTAGIVTTPENFNSAAIVMLVQPAGTRPDLPTMMNPWILYLKTMASITIRNKRGQDVEAFLARLQVDQQRIEKILQERIEEPTQPPLTRNSDLFWGW
jgi:hypothetical protein